MKVKYLIFIIVLVFFLNIFLVNAHQNYSLWFEEELKEAIKINLIENNDEIDYKERLSIYQMKSLLINIQKKLQISDVNINCIEKPTKIFFLTELYKFIAASGENNYEKYILYKDYRGEEREKLDIIHYFLIREIISNNEYGELELNKEISYEQAIAISLRLINNLNQKDNLYNNYLYFVGKVYIDKGYASSSINTSRFRKNSIVKTEKGQFIAYFNQYGEANIKWIGKNKEIKILKITPNLSDSLIGNGHCSINMGYLDNKLFIFYGAHVTSSYYVVIPLENFEDKEVILAKKIDMLMTYPQFYNIKNKLLLFFRKDTNPYNKVEEKYNDICFLEIKNDDINLDAAKTLLKSEFYNSVYINEVAVNSNKFVIPYVYRLNNDGSGLVKNKGFYLIEGDIDRNLYKNINGKKFTLPVGVEKTNKIINVDENRNLMNQDGSYLTNDNYLYFTSIHDDKLGIPQIYLTCVDMKSKKVVSRVVTKNDIDYELSGAGTIVSPLSRSVIVASKDYIHIVYRMNNTMILMSTKRLKDGLWVDNWNEMKPTKMILGAWEPTYDNSLWKEQRILDIFVQNTNQGINDKALNSKPTDIFIFRFKEKENL